MYLILRFRWVFVATHTRTGSNIFTAHGGVLGDIAERPPNFASMLATLSRRD